MSGYVGYPEYRNSGVEWLPKIPCDWSVSYLGFECVVKARLGWKGLKAEEYVEEGFAFLATPNIKDSKIDFINVNFITKERFLESPEIILLEGDVLVTKDGSTTGTTNLVRSLPRPTTVNSSIAVIRPEAKVVSRYIYYFFLSSYTQSVIERMRGGMGVPHLFQGDLRKFRVLLPSRPEQDNIADFLDHETARIDTLIGKQKQLIKLLKEKRQAVISNAVTRGLNSDVPMKDSGVDWLGKVPTGWDVVKLSYVCRVLNGSTPDRENVSFWSNGEVPWLASSCLNSDEISVPTEHISKLALRACSVEIIPKNSLLVGMVGQGKTRGSSALLSIDSCINQNLAAVISIERVEAKFLHYVFQSMYEDLRELGRGGNQPALNCEIIGSIQIPLPEQSDQLRIVDCVSAKLECLERVGIQSRTQVELLEERRSALISAAVTGQIDVRNWQPPKPVPTTNADA